MVTQIFKHFCSTLHLFFNLLIFWVGNTFIKFNIQKLIEGHRVRSLPLLPFSHIVFLSQAPIVTYRQTYINIAIYVYTQTSQTTTTKYKYIGYFLYVNDRNLFLLVLESGSQSLGYQNGWVLVKALFWVADCRLLIFSHERKAS